MKDKILLFLFKLLNNLKLNRVFLKKKFNDFELNELQDNVTL